MKSDILALLASFHRVATTLNFSTSARQLNLSPAALSITIKKLEERLGTRLFERTTRSVRLTDAGWDYWERIAPLLNEINAATEDLQVQAGAEGGVLRLTLGHVTGPLLIEPLLAEFFAQYPSIRIELLYEDRFVDIVKDGFDGGIRIGESIDRDMVAVKLTDEFRLSTYASPQYLNRVGIPLAPSELKNHQCINFRLPTRGGIYQWEYLVNRKNVEFSVDGPLVVNHWSSAINAAISGIGLCHIVKESAAQAVAQGQLIEVLSKFSPSFDGFYFYYPRREQMPKKTRVFLDFLRQQLRHKPK
jgi:DNA-binding transcriptional LysR family regulator